MTKKTPEHDTNDMLDALLAHRAATYDESGQVRPQDSFLKRCALCFGSAAGGGLLAHVGCISIPLAGLVGGSAGALGPVVGAGLSVAGLGAWYGLMGRKQSATKKALVVAFAAAGTIAVAANHVVSADHVPENVDPFLYKICLQTGASPSSCAAIC